MHWSQLRTLAISLPAALLATLILITINEASYLRSHEALQSLSTTFKARTTLDKLMRQVSDAETYVNGYLLTGESSYIDDYQQANAKANQSLDALRTIYTLFPEDLPKSSLLGREVAKRLSRLDVSIQLKRDGHNDAWRYLAGSAEGKSSIATIRQIGNDLITSSTERRALIEAKILRSLMLARIGIAVVSAVGLLAFYLYLRQSQRLTNLMRREQKQLEEERDRLEKLVRRRTSSLGELATHLQQVREDERAHLARELHDELGALLTAAKLDVARLKSKIDMTPDVQERIQHLVESLNNGIALKRRIIEDLRPSSLSNLGLHAALEILGKEFSDSSNIPVDLNLETVEAPEPIQLTIYRTVQESLTNIGKYAHAKRILINLQNYPTYLSIQISDDGVGFDPQYIDASAHGLQGMRHRIEAAGGRLQITSGPAQGTTIVATLPKQYKQAAGK